ncbi:MAG: S1C family serine protease [Planctomycetia bacterium]|nr:S1C family serine protease [Planctomycetia bacterium]
MTARSLVASVFKLTLTVLVACVAAPASAQISKDSKLHAPFKPVVQKATESTVRIRCNDKDAALGTVVYSDGYILTKFSELKGVISVRLSDGTEYEATIVSGHKDTDLALLKIDMKGLKPVTFADSKKIPSGHWLAAAGATSDPIGVGIVSVVTRELTGRDRIISNPNRGFMGIIPVDAKDDDGKALGAKITEVSEGGAAEKAGLRANDIIFEMNGKKIANQAALREYLESLKGGDVVNVKVKRNGEDKAFKVTLVSAPKDRGDIQNSMGSELSNRRTGFPEVLQSDLVLEPKNCGGPVVDLDGNVLGIGICRAGRVESWILPSEVIRPLLPDMKAGKFAPTKASADTPRKGDPK